LINYLNLTKHFFTFSRDQRGQR